MARNINFHKERIGVSDGSGKGTGDEEVSIGGSIAAV